MIERINFPTPYPTLVSCPFCSKGCVACDDGLIEIDNKEAWAQIQRPHVIKFLADNIDTVSKELSNLFNCSPTINTKKNIYKTGDVPGKFGQWTLLEVTTTEGSIWIAIPIEKRKPEYFYSEGEMNRWLA